MLDALRLLLKEEGYRVVTAARPVEILKAVEGQSLDAVLMDLNYARDTTSGREGLDVLARLRGMDATLPVIVMTAYGSVQGAVEAMRRGAADYIEKPWDDERLVAIIRTQVELARARRANERLATENRRLVPNVPPLIAGSRAMQPVLELIERVAASDANVLITGEHGTGKEVVAQRLHAGSHRASRPLITVNAGGLSEGVAESELFGHVKGAFTDAKADRVGCFELADGGTLFLDEIANMAAKLQAKLLRVLQTGEFQRVGSSRTLRADVRVLAATNADIRAEIAAGRFREDLLYRLNTVEVRLPPLRDRRDDIAWLATHFLAQYAARYRKEIHGFDDDATAAMQTHAWPGNVRELQHAVERGVLMARAGVITSEDLGLRAASPGSGADLSGMTMDEAEKYFIQQALARHGGNVVEAAESLGMSRSALYRRIQQHGL
ncbi:MAG: response regulator with CheY-like receiver, AAA-type ATPase, and DNA-binding domain [Geminicoccaceae bacterium]|nr:response regulator with CheY-like receiver, AAA-type ATPase, and DNA-binding domain [Geminicoccaceae bacterium]